MIETNFDSGNRTHQIGLGERVFTLLEKGTEDATYGAVRAIGLPFEVFDLLEQMGVLAPIIKTVQQITRKIHQNSKA